MIEEEEIDEDSMMCEKNKYTFHGYDASYNTYPPNLFQLHFLKVYIFISVVDALPSSLPT